MELDREFHLVVANKPYLLSISSQIDSGRDNHGLVESPASKKSEAMEIRPVINAKYLPVGRI